jgi:hypothetical protein
MMGKSVSYVMCQVIMMTVYYTHVVMNKFTRSPDPVPRWRTFFSRGNSTLCLNACPSVEVFVACSGLGPGRPHSLPLVGGLYHTQRTLTTRASRICPLSEDFVSHSGL